MELSPRLLDLLLIRYEKKCKNDIKLNLLNAGIIASMIYNVNRPKGKKALKAKDFLPKEEEKQNLDDAKVLHNLLSRKFKFKEKRK